MKILLLGVSSSAFDGLRKELESLGHETPGAISCNQAVKTIATDPALDAVLVDVSNSDECGMRLLQSRRTDRRLAQVPIVLVGSSFAHDKVTTYHDFGVFDLILLPVDPATLEARMLRVQRDGKKTILIVDDEEAIAEVLADHLELERYRTIKASSGEQALEILKCHTVHALVTDIMMRGMSGLDLLAEVKTHWPGIPVIMITGYAGHFTPSDVMAAGADGYFAKPFKNLELSYTLTEILSRYRIHHQRRALAHG